MSGVFKAVSKPIKWVGQAVSDVVDFAVDEILKPVANVVKGVVQGMVDDPITTVAMIAAAVTPGMQWAVPLISGASTAMKGGDIKDIAISMAASYAGGKAGQVVGKYVGSAITNETLSTIASKAASGATKGMIVAAATGGDIKKAALTGASSGAISGGIEEAGAYLSSEYGSIDEVKLEEGFTWDEKSFNETSNSVGFELKDIVSAYESLPTVVKDIIEGTAASTIETFVTTGNAPSEKQLASIMTNAAITSSATADYFQENLYYDEEAVIAEADAQGLEGTAKDKYIIDKKANADKIAAQTTKIIGDVVSSAFTGADPYEAYKASLASTFQQDLNKKIDDITGGGLLQGLDQLTGAAQEYEESVAAHDAAVNEVNTRGDLVNGQIAHIQGLLDGTVEIEGLGKYGRADWEADNEIYMNSGGSALGQEAKARQEKWNEAYIKSKDNLEYLQADYQGSLAVYESASEDFNVARSNVFTAQEYLDEVSAPTVKIVEEAFVDAITDKRFNPDEYREIHGDYISDPHKHWLDSGRTLAINNKDHENRITNSLNQNSRLSKFVYGVLDDGTITSTEQIADMYAAIRQDLQDAGLYNVEGVVSKEGYDLAYKSAQFYVNDLKQKEKQWQEENLKNLEEQAAQNVKDMLLGNRPLGEGYEAPLTPEEQQELYDREYKKALAAELEAEAIAMEKKKHFGLAEDVTLTDVLNGDATISLVDTLNKLIERGGLQQYADKPVHEYGTVDKDKPLIQFTKKPELNTYFDPKLNREVTSFFDVDSGTALLLDAKTKEPIAAYTGGIIADNGQVYWPSQDPVMIAKFKEAGIEVPPADSSAETWKEFTEEAFKNPLLVTSLPSQWLDSKHAQQIIEGVANTTLDPTKQADYVRAYNAALQGLAQQGGYVQTTHTEGFDNWAFQASEKLPLPPPLSIDEIAKIVPIAVMDAAQNVTIDSAEYDALSWFAKRVVDLGEGVKKASDWLEENREVAEEWGVNVDRLQKNAGLAVGAGAELISAFNGVTTFFANDRFKYTDARTTDMGRAAQALALLATASQPEDYNKAVESVMASFREQEGFVDSSLFIVNTLIGDDPVAREVMLREVVAKEVLQEVVLLVGSVGTGNVVKNAAKGLAWAGSKAAGKDAVERATIEFAKKMGGGTAWATNAGLQVLETTGAQGAEAYAEIFDELIKAGYSEEAANAEAGKQAVTIAVTSGLIEAVAGRIFDPADALGKAIVGETAAKFASRNLAKKSLGILAEGVSEAGEETAAMALRVNALETLAPNSDLFAEGGKYHPDKIANTYAITATLAAISGKSTAATMTAGSALYNLSTDQKQPPPPPDSPQGGAFYKPYDTGNTSSNMFVNLNPNVYNTVNDAVDSEDPEVKTQAENDVKAFFGYPLGTPAFTESKINVEQNPEAAFNYNTTVDILNTINPDAYHTYNDVSTVFSDSEAESQIGFVPTKQDIQTFIGATLPQETSQAPLTVLKAGVDDYINTNFTTPDEVIVQFGELGYSPTEEEVQQFTGQGPQTERIESIAPYVDPRQTTTDEVLDYFSGLGYEATPNEIRSFVGQGDPNFEATQLPTIDPYVDPRQITRSEVEDLFAEQGYSPTEDDITRFIQQADDPTLQETQSAALAEEFDPLAVSPEEVRQAYEAAGFFGAIDPDVERLAGQYPESELESRIQEALPVATYNSIANMLGKPGQEVTQTDVDFVADIIAQNEVGQELADTASPATLPQEQLMYDVTGDNVIDIADQTMLEQVMAGTVPQTDIASESAFAATGIQGQLQQQTQMQQQIQTQLQTQAEEEQRRRAAQQQQAYMQSLLETSPVKVETPDAKPIEYTYDPFGESIFATQKQEQAFSKATPYAAEGGMVRNTTDEILKIMGNR